MSPTGNETLIKLLQAAAKDEHAAIIQYLRHAYLMGEGETACEIEGIARDEMRHFWILSRWIVKLGGDPTIERGFTEVTTSPVPEWMRQDVAAEDRAIAMYRDYLERIDDPDIRADIAHILEDEERHHGDFTHFVDKTQAALLATGAQEPAPEGEPAIASVDKESLEWGMQHEYAALLQYMTHSFLLHQKDGEVSHQLELQAINEMQHMGWFGEGLAGGGQDIPLTHHGVTIPQDTDAMLEANIKLEQQTSEMYGQFLTRMVDSGLKDVVNDARGHELYHEQLFKRLKRRTTPTPSGRGWTIGSLKRKENS